MTAYEYEIIYYDDRHDEKKLPMLTIKTLYPIDMESKDPKRIGRMGGMVTAHVRAQHTREALMEFWRIYDDTNAAHI